MLRSRHFVWPSRACCTDVARYAIGDVQGCRDELRALLAQLGFSADRDELWFVGDLVNRGPDSLGVLRFVRDLAANATVVLGNHDLHLLAVAYGSTQRRLRRDDTVQDVLGAPDRDQLLDWLRTRPLAVRARHAGRDDLLVHAGVVPQWNSDAVMQVARDVEHALANAPETVFEHMYGDEPSRWSTKLAGQERARFTINVLTRLRYCDRDGRIELRAKGAPGSQARGMLPWFEVPQRASATARVIFGHWSTLGVLRRPNLLALDSGCVWGGALTAADLDAEDDAPDAAVLHAVPCRGYQAPGGD